MELTIKVKLPTKTITQKVDPTEKKNFIEIDLKSPNKVVKVKKITINNIPYTYSFKLEKDLLTIPINDNIINSLRSMKWHYTSKEKDFIFENHNLNNVGDYMDRDNIGFTNEFIPCFGCSITYGAHVLPEDSWPSQLSRKSKKNFLNLGTNGIGIDAIENNLTLLYERHPFRQTIILLPQWERRWVKIKIGEDHVIVPSTIDLPTNQFSHLSSTAVSKKLREVIKEISDDKNNAYSKEYLTSIINFCKEKNIKLHLSSWSKDVYDYIKKNNDQIQVLPEFTNDPTHFIDKASDNLHPGKLEYQNFVGKIIDYV